MRRCRELAARHAVAAETALAAGDDDGARAKAMQEASRALAFDPEHTGARAVLGAMLLETPAGALAAAEAERSRMRRQIVQRGAFTYFAIVVYIIVAGSRIHDAMQERLHAHIWQLEQVLPSQRRN